VAASPTTPPRRAARTPLGRARSFLGRCDLQGGGRSAIGCGSAGQPPVGAGAPRHVRRARQPSRAARHMQRSSTWRVGRPAAFRSPLWESWPSPRLDATRGKVVGDLSQVFLARSRSRAMPGIDAVNHRLAAIRNPAELSRVGTFGVYCLPGQLHGATRKARRPEPSMRRSQHHIHRARSAPRRQASGGGSRSLFARYRLGIQRLAPSRLALPTADSSHGPYRYGFHSS
jgi:hypothetical protein